MNFRFKKNPVYRVLVPALFFLLFFQGCKHKQYLTGYYSWEEFQKQAQWKVFVDEKYHPKQEYLDSIADLDIQPPLKVEIYLGTYCGDSKHWVPRYYQIHQYLPVGEEAIISLDTTKTDEKRLALANNVKKIPTFIFYDNGREIGRITEKPKGRLEKAILQVLKKK